MAGHSKFKNIMHRKGAQDRKRASVFTKIIREITVATKMGGGDQDSNPRLRSAVISARTNNMPKDNIEKAIKKGLGNDVDSNYDEIRYEGYGIAGIAVIVEALTDNRNRTASEVRSTFTKHGGNLGETGSVSYMFDKVGMILYAKDVASDDKMFEVAIEAGASDVESNEDGFEIYCDMADLNTVRENMTSILGFEPIETKIDWKPHNLVAIDDDKALTLLKMIDILEDNDDVQRVSTNADFSDAVLEKFNS